MTVHEDEQDRAIETELDRLAAQDRAEAPLGLEERLFRATRHEICTQANGPSSSRWRLPLWALAPVGLLSAAAVAIVIGPAVFAPTAPPGAAATIERLAAAEEEAQAWIVASQVFEDGFGDSTSDLDAGLDIELGLLAAELEELTPVAEQGGWLEGAL